MKRFSPRAAAMAAALACSLAATPALADNYNVRDGNGLALVLAGKLVSSIMYPFHIMMGLVGGTGSPQAINVDSSGNVSVNCASGCSAGTATGSAVPSSAGYGGVNIGGTLRGHTGVNPSGTIYADQNDLTSVGGTLVTLGQKTMSASIPTTLASDQGPLTVGGVTANPTSVLTRPANTTAYTADNLIASNTTAGSIVVPSFTATRVATGSVILPGLRLLTNKTSGMASIVITVNLWSAAPTYTNGDGGAYAVATGAAGYLGTYTCTLSQFGDGAAAPCASSVGNFRAVKLASGSSIFWDLQATSGFTPASGQTFTLTPEALQD